MNLYFQAAWHILQDFFEDVKWLGATPGVIGAFQSWGETLHDHLHLHFIVTGGGLRKDGSWISTKESFLFPSRAVANKFRGKFCAYLREALKPHTVRGTRKKEGYVIHPPSGASVQQCINLLNKVGRKKWHVEIEPPYNYADGVIKYLARYIRRGPISEKRIRSYDGKNVRIAYKHPGEHNKETFNLPAEEFLRRIFLHVPAKGVHLVRNFGLFHSSYRKHLEQARAILGQQPLTKIDTTKEARAKLRQEIFPEWQNILCPVCGLPLITTAVYYRYHSPPLRKVA